MWPPSGNMTPAEPTIMSLVAHLMSSLPSVCLQSRCALILSFHSIIQLTSHYLDTSIWTTNRALLQHPAVLQSPWRSEDSTTQQLPMGNSLQDAWPGAQTLSSTCMFFHFSKLTWFTANGFFHDISWWHVQPHHNFTTRQSPCEAHTVVWIQDGRSWLGSSSRRAWYPWGESFR